LEEQVAQLLAMFGWTAVVNGVKDLIEFLDSIALEGL
jgi:hypothetical protein